LAATHFPEYDQQASAYQFVEKGVIAIQEFSADFPQYCKTL
jgi:hypothetical protein